MKEPNLTEPSNGSAAYVWTSIPDKVTEVFKSLGHDGIIDWSGKGGGPKAITAPVYIPFEENQVKSALGNKGTFRGDKNDVLFSQPEDPYARFDGIIVKQPILLQDTGQTAYLRRSKLVMFADQTGVTSGPQQVDNHPAVAIWIALRPARGCSAKKLRKSRSAVPVPEEGRACSPD